MVRVAIVGSQGKYWTPRQRTQAIAEIKEILLHHIDLTNPHEPVSPTLVSGGCGSRGENIPQKFDGGVDVWAEIVADILGMEKDIKYPLWFDKKSFEQRNKGIAHTCDVLYCIDPECRPWSGGQWTMKKADELGKETHLIIVREEQ